MDWRQFLTQGDPEAELAMQDFENIANALSKDPVRDLLTTIANDVGRRRIGLPARWMRQGADWVGSQQASLRDWLLADAEASMKNPMPGAAPAGTIQQEPDTPLVGATMAPPSNDVPDAAIAEELRKLIAASEASTTIPMANPDLSNIFVARGNKIQRGDSSGLSRGSFSKTPDNITPREDKESALQIELLRKKSMAENAGKDSLTLTQLMDAVSKGSDPFVQKKIGPDGLQNILAQAGPLGLYMALIMQQAQAQQTTKK